MPATPTNGPALDSSNTNAFQIGVTWNVISTTGGSPITSYELQISLPDTTEWISLVGNDRAYLDTSYTATQNITKGKYHRFRYRAQNAAGWSDFSPITFITAATKPDAPGKPELNSRTSTTLTIGMTQTLDDGGSPVTVNKLFIGAEGSAFSSFNEVLNYDGSATTYTFDVSDSPAYIVTGNVYHIAYIAHNAFGDSEYSTELTVGAGAIAPAPSNLVDSSTSTDPSIKSVKWDEVTTADLPILGYIVQMDDGLGGDFSTVYNGETNPQVLSVTVEDLVPGRDYQFKVQAVDINGAGTETSALTISACVSPSGLDRPTITSISGHSYTLRWNSASNNGG